MRSPFLSLVAAFLIPLLAFEFPAGALEREEDPKNESEKRDLRAFVRMSENRNPLPYRLRPRPDGNNPESLRGELAQAGVADYSKEEIAAMDQLSDAAASPSLEIREHALQGEVPAKTAKRFRSVREIAAKPLVEAGHTVLLVLAASIASLVKSEMEERKTRSLALREVDWQRTKLPTRIYRLADYENQKLGVPIGPNGEFHLGASDDSWQSFPGTDQNGIRFPDARMGTAEVRVNALGDFVVVEKIFDRHGYKIFDHEKTETASHSWLPPLLNPLPDRLAAPLEMLPKKTTTCANELYQNRCIQVFEPDLVETIGIQAGHVVNADIFHAILGTMTAGGIIAGVSVGGAIAARHVKWMNMVLLGIQKTIESSIGRGILNLYLSSCVMMMLTWQLWEGGYFLTEMARGLMHDEESFQRSQNVLARVKADFSRYREAKKALTTAPQGAQKILETLQKEMSTDINVLKELYANMFFILHANTPFVERLISGMYRERIWTTNFFLTVGTLATSTIIQTQTPVALRSGATFLGQKMEERASLRALQDLVKRGALSAGEWGTKVGETHAMQTTAELFVRLGGKQMATLAGRGFTWVMGGVWVMSIFILLTFAIDAIPPEHKFIGTTFMKESVIAWHEGWKKYHQVQLARLLKDPSHVDVNELRSRLASLHSERGGIVNQYNFIRNELINQVQARDREIALAVEGLKLDPELYKNTDLPENPMKDTWSQSWNRLRLGSRHAALEQMLANGIEISEANRAFILHVDERLKHLYDSELAHWQNSLQLDPPDILQRIDKGKVSYDLVEPILRKSFQNFSKPAQDELIRYVMTLVMARSCILDSLHAAPEQLWIEKADAWRNNREMVAVGERVRARNYRDVSKLYRSDYVDPVADSFHNDPKQLLKLHRERASEEANRMQTKLFGWDEKGIAQLKVDDLRTDRHESLNVFPQTQEGWEYWFEVATAPAPDHN